MEENNKSLISINNSLVKIERQIAIGDKLLNFGSNKLQRNKIKNFLISISYWIKLDNYSFTNKHNYNPFISLISGFYPFSEELIMKYQHILDWYVLSSNDKIKFSPTLIEKYSDKWNFNVLGANKSIDWDIDLFDKYKDKFDWRYTIYYAEALPWSIDFVEKYIGKLNWQKFSEFKSFPWSEEFIEKYKSKFGRIDLYYNWTGLSCNRGLPWSEDFLNKYSDKWDWKYLSSNNKLPWSEDFLNKYIDKWDWNGLSGNSGLPWSEDFFHKYIDKWNWEYLSRNVELPWSEDFISKHKDKWNESFLNGWIRRPERILIPNFNENNIESYLKFYNKTALLALDYFIQNPKECVIRMKVVNNMQQYIIPLDDMQQHIIPFIDDSLIDEIINETITQNNPSLKG